MEDCLSARGLITAVLFLTSSPAVAGIVTYTSSSAFNTAIGSPGVAEDYATFTAGTLINPGSTFNGITYTSFNLGALGTQGIISNQFNSFSGVSLGANQSNGAAEFFFDGNSIDISFAPTLAIGVFFNVNANSGTFGVTTPAGTATTGSSVYDTSTFVFAGLVSDTPFTSAHIFSDSGGNGTASFNIPEIILGQNAQATPEPTSIALTALGAGILAAFSRRRKSV
jgi:hypothetical protein